jgi:hypothetical protein
LGACRIEYEIQPKERDPEAASCRQKRWTNGLPGATKRLGAKMAFEVLPLGSLGCARIPMTARSKLLHLRGLIH